MPEKRNHKMVYRILGWVAAVLIFVGLLSWVLVVANDSEDSDINSPANDIARNDGTFKYPSPMESDQGWGEALFPWHMVDGIRVRGNYWAYGLAFTGGRENYEDSCGWRQATIDFGEPRQFNRVVIWHAGDNVDIPIYYLRCWNEERNNWDTLLCKKEMSSRADEYSVINCLSIPIEDTFATVVSAKVQYLFNNCHGDHGWINEFEVYNDAYNDRPRCLEASKGGRKN